MQANVILVVMVLAALSIGAIIWMERHSRKIKSKDNASKFPGNKPDNKKSPQAKHLSQSKMGVNT